MIPASVMLAFARRLWVFVRPHRRRLFVGLACGVLAGAANAVLVVCLRWVLNLAFATPDLGGGGTSAPLALAALTVPAVMLARGLCGYGNALLTHEAASRAVVDLRLRLFAHLQEQPPRFFDRARSGELVSRITSDTAVLHTTIAGSISTLVKAPATLISLAAVLISQQPGLALVVLLVLPLCAAPTLYFGRKLRRSAADLQTEAARWAALMQEAFAGNRVVKAYGLESEVLARCQTHARACLAHLRRAVRCTEIPQQAIEWFGAVGVVLALWLALRGGADLRVGDVFQFVAGVYLMYGPVRSLSRLHSQLEQARAASARVFELLAEPAPTAAASANAAPHLAAAEIEFADVTFGYGDAPVLRGFELRVKPGEFIAVVGASGSGKSTVLNLLLRFYEPQAGAIRVGGVELSQVSPKELRRQLALVAQEPLLFHDTVRRNIGFGRPGATDTEIETAARRAQAHDFIRALPQGYETPVGERGVTLSGGQRQRIAMARALLRDAPVLLLDEATNALDMETEARVLEAVRRAMAGRTVLCVAHRLAVAARADRVVVLAHGQVVGSGTHAELLARPGPYRELWDASEEGQGATESSSAN